MIEHAWLLDRARTGGIDVYFEGDSITRRWRTTDEEYKDFLANWDSNFHGWNAADFGWGADGTQNILWRLKNGELDNVNPKVIVLLGGTNDLGSKKDVAGNIKSILATCRDKAPNATIILTAIFPRNGGPNMHQEINAVNSQLARMADGKHVRFLNVNDKLGDSSGKPFDGLTVDGLHPSLKGYQIWADGLKPILTELLGPPSATDHAPAPIGSKDAAPQPRFGGFGRPPAGNNAPPKAGGAAAKTGG